MGSGWTLIESMWLGYDAVPQLFHENWNYKKIITNSIILQNKKYISLSESLDYKLLYKNTFWQFCLLPVAVFDMKLQQGKLETEISIANCQVIHTLGDWHITAVIENNAEMMMIKMPPTTVPSASQ